ncbi:MAG: hypothetical protein ACRCXC_04215 [Legionella sp.]
MRDGAFEKYNAQILLKTLENDYDKLIACCRKNIDVVNARILTNQKMLTYAKSYGEDGEIILSSIQNEISRQNRYLGELKSTLAQAVNLKYLFSLNPDELVLEAIEDKPSPYL